MRILTRYLLKAHLGPFLFAFFALTSVLLINTLAREMATLAGKGLPFLVVLEFFLLSMPSVIALTLPMAVLVAVLHTFSEMAAENEIMALRASGVDLKRLVAPLFVTAAFIAGGMVYFNDRVLPEANYRWRLLMIDVAQATPLLALQEQTLNTIETGDGESFILSASRIEAGRGWLEDVTIHDLADPGTQRTIYADSGRMVMNAEQTDLHLTLYSGTVRELDLQEPEAFRRMSFEVQSMRLEGVGQRLERTDESTYRTDRDMTIGMMNERIDSLSAEVRLVAEIEGEEGTADVEALNYRIREYKVEIQKKFSIAAASLIFVLVAVPLALRFPQGGIGMVIAASLAIFSIYYVGLIGGESLADAGYMSPALSMWIANIVMGILGVIGFIRLGRESGSGRGGALGEIPRWLRWLSVKRE